MRKTRDLSKKISDTMGTFHANMDTIKDRHGIDLTEAEDIKKRWQEYTEERYKNILMTQITNHQARHPGVQSHVGLRTYHYEQS